ncbi:MAG TPA: NrtA/SsuA/CpmA family ABC transporter substrate-binding protein [Rectinemataceae bacterium]|nr:NrtA/SsuA/CpmA family ABC transporter substrate-binding protein [Rectinemataceae bacterium]
MALLAVSLVSCVDCTSRPESAIVVAVPALEQNALIYIAADKGFFADNGLRVAIESVATGPSALAALQNGSVQIAETAEFPVVVAALRGMDFRILATNDQFENDYIIARKASGISGIPDLKGRRMGFSFHSITEFYLGRFLALHGIRPGDISRVDVAPSDFATAIGGGRVDALVAWQPFVSRIAASLPGGAEVWPVQSDQLAYGILVCREKWLAANSKTAEAFLKSLKSAQDYLVGHPAESRALIGKRLGYDAGYLSSVWRDHHFDLTLDYSLVLAMEDEARWMVANHLTDASAVPDFSRSISAAELTAVSPTSVNMMK